MLFFQQAFDRTIDTGWLMGVPGTSHAISVRHAQGGWKGKV
jgi:hypothetical protein